MSEHHPVSRCLLPAVIVLTAQIAAAQSGGTSVGTTQSGTRFLNPEGLNKPAGYTHVVVSEPRKLVYISGQLSWDNNGERLRRLRLLQNLGPQGQNV